MTSSGKEQMTLYVISMVGTALVNLLYLPGKKLCVHKNEMLVNLRRHFEEYQIFQETANQNGL